MSQCKTRKSVIAISITAALSVAAPLTYAAEAALEEVIVTARKREENLQQVPSAINVLTADALENRQIANIADLERTSPNVTMTETGGSQAGSLQVFMRGIGNDNGFDPGVGLYIDDVFIQRSAGSMLELYDVERIEVLKGPQGNLYGRNTIGGAIKYITKEPTSTLSANVETKVGSYDLFQVKGSVSGPLVDGLLYGGAGLMYKQRDGIQKNTYNGEDLWDVDTYAVRGNLKFTPLDNLTVKIGVDYSHDNSAPRIPHLVAADQATIMGVYGGALFYGNLPVGSPPPDFSGINAGPDHVNSEADYDPYRLQTFTAYLSAEWEINDAWTFKSVTAKRTGDQTFVGEFDGSGLTYLSNLQFFESDDISQEFQVNFSGDSLDGVVGIYYTEGEADTPSRGVITPYALFDRTRTTVTSKSLNELKSWSVYGNLDWSVTDALKLSLGLRQTQDKKTYEQLSDVQFVYGPFIAAPLGVNGPDNFGPESESWSNFSPSLKAAYSFDENTMLYVSYSTGFKSGGFNPYPNASPSKSYDPEEVETYAIGLKTTLLNGRLRLNTEAFYNDYTDKQLQYLGNVGGNIASLFTNAGAATTQGIETEISWLTPIDGLQVDVNIGYLQAEIDEFNRFVGGTEQDVAGHSELGFSPEWTIQPRVSYSMAIGDVGDLMFAMDASYRSKSFTNSPVDTGDATDRQQVQREHVIVNANIVFNSADNHWRVALEGKNLDNKRVLTNTFNLNLGLSQDPTSTSTFVLGSYNDPRTWAVSATYKY